MTWMIVMSFFPSRAKGLQKAMYISSPWQFIDL